jgi:hypothetical protein
MIDRIDNIKNVVIAGKEYTSCFVYGSNGYTQTIYVPGYGKTESEIRQLYVDGKYTANGNIIEDRVPIQLPIPMELTNEYKSSYEKSVRDKVRFYVFLGYDQGVVDAKKSVREVSFLPEYTVRTPQMKADTHWSTINEVIRMHGNVEESKTYRPIYTAAYIEGYIKQIKDKYNITESSEQDNL